MPSMLPLVMGRDVLRHFHWLRSSSRSIYAALIVFVLVVFTLSGFFFVKAISVEERDHLAQTEALARSIAASIEAREQGYLNVLRSYAGRFRFRESVKRQDRGEALAHLRQLHRTFPELDRVFLADRSGIVWATEPETPEIYGRSYAFRDWYRGVSRDWQPYMSEVYQTDVGHTLAVALVMPIRDVDERVGLGRADEDGRRPSADPPAPHRVSGHRLALDRWARRARGARAAQRATNRHRAGQVHRAPHDAARDRSVPHRGEGTGRDRGSGSSPVAGPVGSPAGYREPLRSGDRPSGVAGGGGPPSAPS